MSKHLGVPNSRGYRAVDATFGQHYISNKGKLTYTGEENIPQDDQPYVITPVHRNWRDILVVTRIWLEQRDAHIHFMAAKDMLETPKVRYSGLGRFLKSVGAFPVDRDSGVLDDQTREHLESIVENNGVIGIFPEGDCLRGNDIDKKKVKLTTGALAAYYGLALVPVGIAGTDPLNSGQLHAHVGEPISVGRVEFDLQSPRSVIKVGRAVTGELFEGMQAAQQIAHNERLAALEPTATS